MIHFVLFEYSEYIKNKIENCIHQTLFRLNQEYTLTSFESWNDEAQEIIKHDSSDYIYIIDIELGNKSGVDIAREIRNHGYESVIIFVSNWFNTNRYMMEILTNSFLFLSYINLHEDFTKKLSHTLEHYLTHKISPQVLQFKSEGIFYTIPLRDIFSVTADTTERRTIITTDYSTFSVTIPLQHLQEQLSERFIRVHRACIVNIDKVVFIDFRKRIIFFQNGKKTDLVSIRLARTIKEKMKEMGINL